MSQEADSGSDKLLLLIKSAYWAAFAIIVVMALSSFLLLQQINTAQQRDQNLLDVITKQKMLSQKLVSLARTVISVPRDQQPPLVAELRRVNTRFEHNYDELLKQVGNDSNLLQRFDPTTLENVLYGDPFHLDYFSTGLAAGGWRFIAAFESQLGIGNSIHGYKGGSDRIRIDESLANAALAGYSALGERLSAQANRRVTELLDRHRLLFYAIIGAVLLVALFIFRPMSKMILRRTHELVEARNSMAFIAAHDGLTGLHNRAFLMDHFESLIANARRRNEHLAVVQLDLDRFKQINDTLGHAAGDRVLISSAQRMRNACRASDLCVRLGGDEFVIVLSGAGSIDDVDAVVRRILERLSQPIVHHGATIVPGASAGIAIYPHDADNAEDLLVHADLALYSAKKAGNSGFAFFCEDLRNELEHRKQLENDIKVAIANEAFSVYFQPQISLSSGRTVGVEALVRWRHPERGMVSPGEFIPVAEKCGLMAAIGRIVISKAIREAAAWHRAGIEFGRLAVNASGTELREADFEQFLFHTLEREGLPIEKISLEIVESVILDDEKSGIAAKLRNIRAAGIHLELDDFGTGYASLTHVSPNDIDRVKIDRRFVQNIDAGGHNAQIVRAITDLANRLGIAVVAEGAETQNELDTLLAIGCDQVQGYSVAFPMPDHEARDWLVTYSAKRAGQDRPLAESEAVDL
ncbi:GGDEF-domain containing protein [Mesorhizobium soli]|uniref:GGDEF-domain containing protein n=1 Tax=Pseudaminobacter soli (ex Li et al. 2025) TaxID=1295366 RepID=A0A2P7S872_9HYPH|nr:GGDEF-domain containing protein [Mesorhizobium soli]